MRDLTDDDMRTIEAGVRLGADIAFRALADVARETCGFRLLTVLQYDEARGEVVRRFSSDPAYPIGGRKPLADYAINHGAMAGDGIFLAATRADVARAYKDHDALFAMGITAILNVQIRDGGARLATLNFCGSEGQYGARETAIARRVAAALAPCLRPSA